jgi:hypothetical protein
MSKPSNGQSNYTLADEVLVTRATRGDTDAQTVLYQRRAVRQMCTETVKKSSSRDYQCYLSEKVRLHFRKDQDGRGRVHLFLEIGESTSLEAIKKKWKEIRTWWDLLLEWQGPSPYGSKGFFYQLYLDHQEGESYADIAKRLNAQMVRGLKGVLERNFPLRQAIGNGTIRTVQDLTHWKQTTESDTSDLYFIQGVLQDCGFLDEDIDEWCFAALENLTAGRKALPPGVPFKRDWVISRLRNWRTKNQLWLTTVNGEPHRIPNT